MKSIVERLIEEKRTYLRNTNNGGSILWERVMDAITTNDPNKVTDAIVELKLSPSELCELISLVETDEERKEFAEVYSIMEDV